MEGVVPSMRSSRKTSLRLRARRMVMRRITREARVALMARGAGARVKG
jgi:hypothetical protein